MFFPAFTPIVFTSPLAAELELEGTNLAHIESHCDEGIALLLPEFKGKPRLEALLCAYLEGVQDAEDAVWGVLVGRAIDNAIGAQLDGIGEIVDLPRSGWLDDTYSALLGAQVLALRSCGTWTDLIAVLRALGHDVELAEAVEYYPAAATLVAGDPPGNGVSARDEFNMLDRARPAGVRFFYEFPPDDASATFTLSETSSPVVSTALGCGDSVAGLVGGTLACVFATTAEE